MTTAESNVANIKTAMFPLFACVINLVTTSAIFHGLRLVARTMVPRKRRLLAEEFITTMDFCSGCCELAFLCDMYGALIFGPLLFAMCVWWCYSFGDAAANPNKYVEDVIRGRMRPNRAGQMILAQIVAGSLVFTYMRYLWAFGWSHAHLDKSSDRNCHADLQVTVKNGAIIEGIITFIDRLNALTLEEMNWPQSTITTAGLSTFLVLSALHSSGGYFNPVLASSLKFGCQGHSFVEFFLVYWVGSVIGSVLALTFHQLFGVKKILELTGYFRIVKAGNKQS